MDSNAFAQLKRNEIRLNISGAATQTPGGTRFGGVPDVPADFLWPTFETNTYDDDTVKHRPLSFLAQFNCAEFAGLDREGLLPQTGLLSFFYELDAQRWGFDPKDSGCARVYWFADTSALAPAAFPESLDADFRLPMLSISAESAYSLPDWSDFARIEPHTTCAQWETMLADADGKAPDACSRLLGWPNIIQNNMTLECALVTQGHYLGGLWDTVSEAEKAEAASRSVNEWRLLFQLDTVEQDDFELMFGDCGSIYFYIRKADLAERRFDRVWLILQCY